jgi:hypothetical protein
MWNIPWLEQEGNRNVDNPGRAVGKAATAAATWWLGNYGAEGLLGTAGQAGASAAQQAAQQAAEEAAKQAAMQAAMQGGEQAAIQIPQGLMNTMEAGMMDTGYTPSSLFQAIKNTGQTTPLQQNLLNFGKQQMVNAQNGSMANGLLSNMGDSKSAQMMKMGSGLMDPPQQQPMPMAPPPRQQAPQEPLPMPYGGLMNSLDGPPPGMTLEEWEKMKRMRQGLLGRMQ